MKLNRSGLSLMSTIVAVGVGAVIITGLSQFLVRTFKSQKRVHFRVEVEALAEEMRGLLSSRQACTNSFTVLELLPSLSHDVSDLMDATPSPGVARYSTNTIYGDNTIRLRALAFENYRPSSALSGDATLRIEFEDIRNPSQWVVRSFEIRTEHDGSNNLASCVATSKMNDGIWQRSMSNLNNIFFPGSSTGGNVGIGVEPPIFPGTLDQGHGLFVFNNPERGYGGVFSSWLTLGGLRTVDGSTGFNMITDASHSSTDVVEAQLYREAGVNGDLILRNSRGNGGGRLATSNNWNAFTVNFNGQIVAGAVPPPSVTDVPDLAGFIVQSDPNKGYGGLFSSWINLGDHRSQNGSTGLNLITDSGTPNQPESQIYREQGPNGFLILHNRSGSNGVRIAVPGEWDGVVVNSGGNVGIGVANPTSKLQVNGAMSVSGNIRASGTVMASSSGVAVPSDLRVKTQIQPIENSLDLILRLNPVSYKYKKEYTEISGVNRKQIGFVAQEVSKVIPEAVSQVREVVGGDVIEDFNALSLSTIIPFIVGSIKELFLFIQDTDNELNKLKSKLRKADSDVESLRDEIYQLKKIVEQQNQQITTLKNKSNF